MYKKRFAKWGFGKNKRRAARNQDRRTLECSKEAGSGSLCTEYTPSTRQEARPSLGGRLPLLQENIYIILSEIRHWNDHNFSANNWSRASQHKTLLPVRHKQPDRHDSSELYRTFALGSRLFEMGEGALAGRLVRKAFLVLESVLESGEATMMGYMIRTMYHMRDQGQLAVLRLFLRHSQMLSVSRQGGKACSPQGGPLVPIFARLAPLAGDELAEVLERMWRCNIDMLEQHLGSRHLSLYDQLISSFAERWLGERLDACRDVFFSTLTEFAHDVEAAASSSGSDDGSAADADPHPGASIPDIYKLLLKLVQTRPPEEGNAEQFAEQLLESASPDALPSLPSLPISSTAPYADKLTATYTARAELSFPTRAKTAAYARKLLASSCARRRDWHGCLAHKRAVVSLRAAVYGYHNPRVVLEMLSLEDALRRAAASVTAAGCNDDGDRVISDLWLAEAAEVRRLALEGAGKCVGSITD